MNATIPQKAVYMTSKDKGWMTPVTKLLINEKWQAYRQKNWSKYNHLKTKVQTEITKAKDNWAQRLKQSNYGLWKLTKHLSGKADRSFNFVSITEASPPVNLAETIAQSMFPDINSITEVLDEDLGWGKKL